MEYKIVTELEPGEIIVYQAEPHQVIATPRQSEHFSFHTYLALLNLHSRERLDEIVLSSTRVMTFTGGAADA